MLGDADFAIGAGVESMSRGPYVLPSARWGARMGNAQVQDYLLGVLHDPFHGIHMGITAENIAERNSISRETQDRLAHTDQQRAAHAIAHGYFERQITPVEVQTRKGTSLFSTDEHPRATSLEQLAGMKPAFKKDGTVTAGNASGLNDGAAALVLASADAVLAGNLKPMARLVAYAHAGVEPELMGLGPIPATRLALQRAGLHRRHGRDRNQHRLRSASVRRDAGTGHGPGQGQPQRLGDSLGPSGGCNRRDYRDQSHTRVAAHSRPLRARHPVHRRRPGIAVIFERV